MKHRWRLPLIAPWLSRWRGLSLQEQRPPGHNGSGGADDPPPQPPRPPRRPNQGPPDLDELWRDFNRKLGQLFGGGGQGGGGHRRGGGGGLPNLPQPDMKGAGIGVAVIVVIAALVWLGSGFFIVREGQQAVVTQFGQYSATVGAGLNWRLPWPIQSHEIENVTQIRSVDVGSDATVQSTGLHESAMLTADENIVEIKFSVQYRLSDARAYLFNTYKPADAVKQAAESAVREVVGQMTMDNAMAEERDQIAPHVRDLMQTILDRYKVGIEVVAVNLQQSGVSPPEQVKPAFDDVLKAGQERVRLRNEAQAYANSVVPRANGTAARAKQDSEGYKASVVAQAEGDAQRFSAVLAQYEKAPQVTRDRLYIDAMREIYGNSAKVLVDGRAAGNLIYLPLDKVLQTAGAKPPAGASPSASPAAAPVGPNAPLPGGPAAMGTPALDNNLVNDIRSRDSARLRDREGR